MHQRIGTSSAPRRALRKLDLLAGMQSREDLHPVIRGLALVERDPDANAMGSRVSARASLRSIGLTTHDASDGGIRSVFEYILL
jgi:hypothetical protein